MRTADEQEFPILRSMESLPIPSSREIKRVYLHHSVSMFGDAEMIDGWHKDKGWTGIGYNTVVSRSMRDGDGFPAGVIQLGRSVNIKPAHVLGDNKHSIGVCAIGLFDKAYKNMTGAHPQSTGDQEVFTLLLLATYCKKLNLPTSQVLGHREAVWVPGVMNPKKTCPGMYINMDGVRALLYDIIYKHYDSMCERYFDFITQFKQSNPQHKYWEGDVV